MVIKLTLFNRNVTLDCDCSRLVPNHLSSWRLLIALKRKTVTDIVKVCLQSEFHLRRGVETNLEIIFHISQQKYTL